MKRRTKALDISPAVKRAVYERDNGCCIICGKQGLPNAHYIARSHGGLGIEQNIVTLCADCHRRYDQTIERKSLRPIIANYLRSQYPGFNPANLIYHK